MLVPSAEYSAQDGLELFEACLQGPLSLRAMERFPLRDALVKVEKGHASTIQELQSHETTHDQFVDEVKDIYAGFGTWSLQSGPRNTWTPFSHQGEVDNGDVSLFRQPKCREITHDQLVNDVKGIYAGLVMVEKMCVKIDIQQSQSNTKLSAEQWQALTALHRTLLHEHHEFFLVSRYSTASDAIRRLTTKYAMSAFAWRQNVPPFLALSRTSLHESLDLMLTSRNTYSISAAPLMATVLEIPMTWVNWLRKLAQYQMVMEDTAPEIRCDDSCARAEMWLKAFSSYSELYSTSSTINGLERFPEHDWKSFEWQSFDWQSFDWQSFDLPAWFFSKPESLKALRKTPQDNYFEPTLQPLWELLQRSRNSWSFFCTWCLDASICIPQVIMRLTNRIVRNLPNNIGVCRLSGSYARPLQSGYLIFAVFMSSHVPKVNAQLKNLDRPGMSGHEAEKVLHWLLAAALAAIAILSVYYTARRQRRRLRLFTEANVTQIAAFCSNFANFGVSVGDANGPVLLFVGLTSAGNLLVFWHDVFSGRDPRHIWLIASFFGALLITGFMCSAGGNTSGNGASLPFAAILYAFMFGFIWVCSWALPERNEVNRAGEEDVEHATGPTLPQDSESINAASIAEVQPGLTRLTELMGSVQQIPSDWLTFSALAFRRMFG